MAFVQVKGCAGRTDGKDGIKIARGKIEIREKFAAEYMRPRCAPGAIAVLQFNIIDGAVCRIIQIVGTLIS